MTLTSFAGAAVPKPFSWSFSKLDQFRNCPKKLYHTSIKRDFPEATNEHMQWGNRVHDAMAKRVMHSSPLPAGMEQWEKWALWALANSDGSRASPLTKTSAELKMAITEDIKRCEYFDKRVAVWFRTVADVLKVNGNLARLIDWKTGKVPQQTPDQLALGAFTVFVWYPEVEAVLSQFVYLAHDVKDEEVFHRRDMSRIMMRSLPDVMALKAATESGDFPPKPSGLCKKHCNVASCAYHKRGAF